MRPSRVTGVTDAKPVGHYTPAQLIALEHKWRLKLKDSGFSDVEMWDNKPRHRVKRVKFIKGHIRLQRHKTLKRFVEVAQEGFEYFRVIGLFAHHAPAGMLLEKYRLLLQDYATTGYRLRSIRDVAPEIKPSAIEMYLLDNFPKMLKFVREMDQND